MGKLLFDSQPSLISSKPLSGVVSFPTLSNLLLKFNFPFILKGTSAKQYRENVTVLSAVISEPESETSHSNDMAFPLTWISTNHGFGGSCKMAPCWFKVCARFVVMSGSNESGTSGWMAG